MGVVLREGCDLQRVFIEAERIDFAAPNVGYLILDACRTDGFAITESGEATAEAMDEFHEASLDLASQPLAVRDEAKASGRRDFGSASAVAVPEIRFDLNDSYLRGRNTPQPAEGSHPSVMRIYKASERVRTIFEHGGDAFNEALSDEYRLPEFPRFRDVQDNVTRLPDPEELDRFNELRRRAELAEMTLEDIINAPWTIVDHDDGTTISAGVLPLVKGGKSGLRPALEMRVEGKSGLYVPVRGLQRGEILWYPGRVGASLSGGDMSPTYHRVANLGLIRSAILYFDSIDHRNVLNRLIPPIRNMRGWRRARVAARIGQRIEREFQYVPS